MLNTEELWCVHPEQIIINNNNLWDKWIRNNLIWNCNELSIRGQEIYPLWDYEIAAISKIPQLESRCAKDAMAVTGAVMDMANDHNPGSQGRVLETIGDMSVSNVKFEFQLFLNFCRRCKSFTCSFDLEKHMQKHAKLYEKQIKSTIWSYALWISLSIFEYLWVGMLQGPCAKWVASGHAPGPKDGGSHLN